MAVLVESTRGRFPLEYPSGPQAAICWETGLVGEEYLGSRPTRRCLQRDTPPQRHIAALGPPLR